MEVRKYEVIQDEKKKNVLMEQEVFICEDDSFSGPAEIYRFMKHYFMAPQLAEEHVWMIAMTTRCKAVGVFELSHGAINGSLLSPMMIFTRLLLLNASSFVIVHNHPSGDCEASDEDKMLTEKIREASKIMGFNFTDHIIVGDDYFSMREGLQ